MYPLEFLPSAVKELKKLDRVAQKKIKEKLELLIENPDDLKNNIKALKGEYSVLFRLRVNHYQVIFKVEEERIVITIVRVGHRKDIY
ncbi:MAG TPA: type II toxin-antitoxin system RelE/ParE family toxin [Arcobacter sp.]|nr:type II toxin-antitoxin system RelE/ParE family toxin [Arcobacter sp.]